MGTPAPPRRAPRLVPLAGLVVLAGSLALTWTYFRPGPPPVEVTPADQLDIYCSGRVDAAGQVIALEPAQAGRVVAVFVAEGATVAADDPLVGLDADAAEVRVLQATAAVEAIDIELQYAKQAVDRFPTQLAGRTALVNAAGARAEAARKTLEQRKKQGETTPIGPAEIAAAAAEVNGIELLEAAERASLEDTKKLPAELALRVRAAGVRKKSAEADFRLAEKAKAECVLRAPGPGTVLRLQATVGGFVSPGTLTPPVVFAPAGPYVVRAEVDQEALGRIATGLAVEIRDENRPTGPVWAGAVKSVGRWVAQRRVMVLEPGEISDVRTVECVVELKPGGDPLTIGQRMRVRIIRTPPGGSTTPPASGR